MTADAPRAIVIAPFATPNGPLHAGHLAGPYLNADVYARYLRASGRSVVFPTGTDDNQTYVTSTALRRGVTADQLLADSADGVRRSVAAAGISTTGFVPAAESYATAVLDFLTALHDAGRLALREVPLPYSEARGEFLLDGLVAGECPVCLDTTCGGVCESCGHPVDYAELRDLRSTVDPADPVTLRPTALLVLPMEEYREQLTRFHAERPFRWRPHIEQLIGELLARPLLDLPITYPIGRGIPAPFAETPGQVINPWAEAMAQCIHGSWYALAEQGERTAAVDEHWKAEHAAELVYFLGFDNAPNWAMTYVALLLAHGERYVRPTAIVCNEFYELGYEKFSTSRNHVVWSEELIAEVPRDLARFYLALTSPEFRRSNFSRAELPVVVNRRLVEPWNALAEALAKASAPVAEGTLLDVSAQGRRRAAALAERLRPHYRLPSYSISAAAEAISAQLGRLRDRADRVAGDLTALADLLFEVRTLLAYAAPILIDTAERAAAAGIDLVLERGGATIAAFTLPELPGPELPGPAVPGPAVPGPDLSRPVESSAP
ncbi:class I tRNA ligase family protein [Kitasatospora sp. LaBMicrA B282]|uniref:class I tRNA ligase family protein n=1 Tax=Kitasatospora sp. LaBMicrA B282 TaxID=3420949 RepID=UPI003D1213BF